jgi:glycosyltransferase involved in cell wall biosynthesis
MNPTTVSGPFCLAQPPLNALRCQSINDLPAPPPGRVGWPWTEGSPQLPSMTAGGCPWPRVSIVTPSYNQGQFLEETIRSVLSQGYPDLEYIVIDGGSTDGSAEIIRKYEPWLAYCVSERDAGQSDAIAKGFARATGEFAAWLNSDDLYLPGAVGRAAAALSSHADAALIFGGCEFIDDSSLSTGVVWRGNQRTAKELVLEGNGVPQQAAFMRRACLVRAGGVDISLRYVMDHELWVRLALVGDLLRRSSGAVPLAP